MRIERSYRFEVHMHIHPNGVLLDGESMEEYNTMEELEQATDGWFYDPVIKLGLVYIKTQSIPLNNSFSIEIDGLLYEKENSLGKDLVVVPNPTTGEVNISAENIEILEVLVYSINGNPVKDSVGVVIEGGKCKLYLVNLPNGIYNVEVITRKGRFTKKITLMK